MIKKLTAVFLTISVACLPSASVSAHIGPLEQNEKQYVIVVEEENMYDEISDRISQNMVEKVSGLEAERVVVARLTKSEAEALNEDEDIIIEEDMILTGSMSQEVVEEKARNQREDIGQTEWESLDNTEEKCREERENEWNLQAVNAEDASEEMDVSQKVKVAVMDSGIDYVAGINLAGYVNLIEGEEELSEIFQDATGHGTGIAGIISGNGWTGISGINPNAEVYSVKVLDDENKAPLSRIISGIYWCIEHKMNIINMSFGTPVYSKALEQAVKDAYSAGLLMVGAAGNGGGSVEYPAAYPEVMAVASVNPEAKISSFSNTGEELEVAAPGEKVRVASFFDGNEITHGTSIAVPHVTGAASLLWEKDLTKSNVFIRQLIQQSVKEIEGTDECGLLDVGYAKEMYDIFTEGFEEEDIGMERRIPENTDEPERFVDVNTSETYVEGKWSGTDHKGEVDKGNSGLGFSSTEISIIKQGAVYPDKNINWTKGQYHPWWHGRWQTKDITVWNEQYNKNRWTGAVLDVNYISVLEMITKIALRVGEIGEIDIMYNPFAGMDYYIFNEIVHDINNLKYKDILSNNTKANKKYFLYGCAIHSITDAFAHSTTRSDGTKISHTGTPTEADDINYYSGRYKMALYVTEYALKNLKNGTYSDGNTVLQGIKKKYQNGDAKFKMIKIKPYLNAHGYNAAVLDKLNINQPLN